MERAVVPTTSTMLRLIADSVVVRLSTLELCQQLLKTIETRDIQKEK